MYVIAREEGIGRRGLMKGIEASSLRLFCYCSTKFGLYEPIKDALGASDKENTPFYVRFAAGALAGGIATAVFNPFELIKVQSQANRYNSKPMKWYMNTIYRRDGIPGYYKGVVAAT